MARTPLAQAVEEAAARIANEERRVSRGRLLKGAGASVVGASLFGKLAHPPLRDGATHRGSRSSARGSPASRPRTG